MNCLTKTFSVVLISLIALNLFLPQISSAEQGSIVADTKTIKSQPEVLATPEEDIPVEKVEKGGVSWLWIILGIVAIGGAAAAAGGGGSTTGAITGTW